MFITLAAVAGLIFLATASSAAASATALRNDPDNSLLPADSTITSVAGGTVTMNDLYLRRSVEGTANACYFTSGPTTGNLANANSDLLYSNVGSVYSEPFGVTDGLGSAMCGTNGVLDATLQLLHNEDDDRLTLATS